MQMVGEYRIEAPAKVVWEALNDPEVLARSIDGCESMEKTEAGAFRAKVRAKVGPVSAIFEAEVAITEPDPPHAYKLTGAVKGGPAGFGKGSAKVNLSDEGGATVLRYEVEGSVGGKLAQIGQRLIDASARKMADDFFGKFAALVGSASAEAAPVAAAPEPRRTGGRNGLAWVIGAGVAIGAVVAVALLSR